MHWIRLDGGVSVQRKGFGVFGVRRLEALKMRERVNEMDVKGWRVH